MVGAVVVWFNPHFEYVETLRLYSANVGHVWIIDNSSIDHSFLVPSNINLTYIWLGKNLGIAHALNVGCQQALNHGCNFVLTMDQDSAFATSHLQKHLRDGNDIFCDQSVAIVATSAGWNFSANHEKFIRCLTTITSGNLLRLSAWKELGGFNSKLFIDQVDHEFCYRLIKNRKKIMVNTEIPMNHNIGDQLVGTFFGRRISTTNHHWVRRYYQVRNSLYLRNKFPEYSKPAKLFIRELLLQIVMLIILEKHVYIKLRAILFGVWDYLRNRYGAWNDWHKS